MAYYQHWSSTKKHFSKNASGNFSKSGLKVFGKGANFGPALKKFDKSKSYEDRVQNVAGVLRSVSKYKTLINGLAKDKNITAAGKKALKSLSIDVAIIWDAIQNDVKPPKPSNRAKKIILVAQQNAARGVRPTWLEVGAIDISAYLVVDSLVDEMEKNGELGYVWVNLIEECKTIVNKSAADFRYTLKKIDKSLSLTDKKEREKSIKIANGFLRSYANIVEQNINDKVDKFWANILKRRKYLKDFKKACKVDIAVGGVTIAASTTSIILTFGLAAASVLAIAKAIADIAIAMDKLSRDADKVEEIVRERMVSINELCLQRKDAKRKNKGQKAAKTKEALKEGAGVLLGQISGKLFTTVSRTQKEVKEFAGKLTLLEQDAAQMYKQINQYTSQFPSSPSGVDARSSKDMARAHNEFKTIKKQYETFNNTLRSKVRYANWADDVCEQAKNEDYVPGKVKQAGAWGGALAGIASAGSVMVKTVIKFA